MEPIGAAASIVTLIATIKTAKECLEQIRRSRNAPGLVLELLNEASDFQVLLTNVEAFNMSRTLGAKAQYGVQQALSRANKAFEALLVFVRQDLFKITEVGGHVSRSSSPTDHTKPILQVSGARASRWSWFNHEKELAKHRDSVRLARESLHFALTVANTGIHLEMRGVFELSQLSLKTELLADMRSMMLQMANANATRPPSPSASSDTTLRPASPDNLLVPDQNATRSRSSSVSSGRTSTTPDPGDSSVQEAVCFKTTVSTTSCPRSCSCNCHLTALVKTPQWMNQVTGLLFMRYSGTPLLYPSKCSTTRCKERHQSRINASYYFPWWMFHRMIEIVARWDSSTSPTVNLRVMRVLPDNAALFAHAREGSTAGIQDLFLRGLASPYDIRGTDGRSALHIAIYNGHVSTAQFLLDQKADREYKDRYFTSAVEACWQISLQKLPFRTIEPCVIGGPTEYSDFIDERDFTSVHKIVLGISSLSLDDYLSLSNADIDKKDVMGKTPLHFAAARGDLNAVLTLLRHGADPNLTTDALWTPLIEAAMSSNHRTLRPLLMAGARIDAQNKAGQTALSMAASIRDDLRYLDPLLEYQTNIHLTDKAGLTALHRSCIRDRLESARRLITLQADVDALDEKGYSTAHTCVLHNSHNVLKLLLESGARADRLATNGRTLLHDAAVVGDLSTIALLSNAVLRLDGLDPDAIDEDGQSAQGLFNDLRHTRVSETDEERTRVAFALQILLDKLRERHRIHLLSEKLSEILEVQSTVSDEEFFEAMDLMESSVESLPVLGDLTAPLLT
ncbi:hypothetical protein LTR15_008074 [Elasticomyces elasticus]|nr:hypothetical protein LTR15_008074 [Elasticomyces elasticus]